MGCTATENKPQATPVPNTATSIPTVALLVSATTATPEKQIEIESTAIIKVVATVTEVVATVETEPIVADVMVKVSAGSFIMGNDKSDPEDAPVHQVELPAFEIDKFEVTNADFTKFVESTGYQTFAEQKGYASWRNGEGVGKENHPVVRVTWDDANAYCTWLKKRLPSEAEWEKAARGNDGRTYPWGNDWKANKANVKEIARRTTMAVGSFTVGASPDGAEDMVGNVWEWTADWYQPYPGNTTKDVYYGEKFRVTRGGGWFDEQPQATAFNRNAADPYKTANDDLGFRCVR